MATEIRKITSRNELKQFVRFQLELYKGNPYWCPPLIFDELNTLGKDKNPAFESCEAEYWLAYRENKIVGRVAGIINSKANERWNEKFVRFELSSLAAIYNYPYYPEHMVKLGFAKGVDWVHFEMGIPQEIPDKVTRAAAIARDKYHLRTVPAKKAKDFLPYTKKMFRMMNVAFGDLYGYAALNDRQIDLFVKQYFGFVRPEFVSLVIDEKEDVIAFGVTTPEMTHALQKCNGRLFPFGFIHLYRALKKNDSMHMYLIGVRPDYQGRGALALVYEQLHIAYLKLGIVRTTTHAQLENNLKAISIWKNYDNRIYCRRRCWEKHI
ncbi:MAG: hypothetical protein NTW10_08185 [Bacteroidetes bacterium]|nr:hypothetical protein [Bacteroidota bacterium]